MLYIGSEEIDIVFFLYLASNQPMLGLLTITPSPMVAQHRAENCTLPDLMRNDSFNEKADNVMNALSAFL